MYIFLIIILIFIIPYLFNYSFLCENNNNHLVNSNTFFSPIALDYHYCCPRKTKNKIKTKLKEKQISHNVKIHRVSPCDSLPPWGEHALSPCVSPSHFGCGHNALKRACSGGWVWEKPVVVPFLGQQRGCSGETYGQRLQRTSNMADGELQIYQSLKTQQSSTCIPWICGILWRMATTRFQLNTLSISFLCTVC